jgi:pantoate--beta-alanine ligase
MGALHLGHIFIRNCKKENDEIISSIFVNPTQFNNPDDFEKYPQTLENDLKLLEKAGVDAVYVPKAIDIYPEGLKSKHYDFDGLDNEMEGKYRPGHFDGVGTVVEELLRQVQPHNAYFGEKDYQQLAIIKKMVEKTKLPVKIHGVPT